MPIVGGAYYILEKRGNHVYTALDIRIISCYEADDKTSLVLLSVLGEGTLDNLYPLGSCRICNNNGGYIIKCYICVWLLVSILGQAVEVGSKKVI
jgi:hypothetical protein